MIGMIELAPVGPLVGQFVRVPCYCGFPDCPGHVTGTVLEDPHPTPGFRLVDTGVIHLVPLHKVRPFR